MLIDTHCHLHFKDFDIDRGQVIDRALAAGIYGMITVGTDAITNQASLEISRQRDCIFSTVGLHPHHALEVHQDFFDEAERLLGDDKVVAIGEVGLDYYKNSIDPSIQKDCFLKMIHLAKKHDRPLVIHSREAFRDTMDLLLENAGGNLRGVMHCFSYDESCLREVLDQGLLVSWTGNITFKNATALAGTARYTPLDRMMLETDAPYLAPQVFRGKRNEPAYLTQVAEFISKIKNVPLEQICRTTSETAMNFFNLKKRMSHE